MTRSNKSQIFLNLAHITLGLGLFHLQIFHTRNVFENETKYSHLTRIERETLFTGEHAMYYSYYKTIVEAPNFAIGFNKLLHHNLTEYPHTINVLKYFHVFPEVAIGFLYKEFINVTEYFGIKSYTCWTTGDAVHSDLVIGCDGFGDPMNFYLEAVWILGGSIILLLYFYATLLSRNMIGGLAAVAYFFCAHNDATRMHKTPAARENFAMPFILWQMFHLTASIKSRNTNYSNNLINFNISSGLMVLKLIILSLLANLSWQFSSFIFVTQTIIMLILLQLNIIKPGFFFEYGFAHYTSNALATCIMFDNRHFALCLQHPMFILVLIYLGKSQRYQRRKNEAGQTQTGGIMRWLYENAPFIVAFLNLLGDIIERLQLTGRRHDDVNFLYWDIFLAKFSTLSQFIGRISDPKSFDTLLYMCKNELSFIDWGTVQEYNQLFFSKMIAIFIVVHLSKWLQHRRKKVELGTDESIERSKNYLIEDFLEENKITMKDLVNPTTDTQLQQCLDQLKECNYDYNLYQQRKQENVQSKVDERQAFLNDVKKFKQQIFKAETTKQTKLKTDKQPENIEIAETNSASNVNNEQIETSENLTDPKTPSNDSNDQVNNATTDDSKSPTDSPSEGAAHSSAESKIPFVRPFYLYNLLQTSIFLLMTCFVIKLKYVLTPFLCLIASTFPPKNWFNKAYHLYWIIYTLSIVFSVADPGLQNFQKQYQPKEYNYNGELSTLIHWINANTDENAVFASPSDIITTVMLSTRRPIVNHHRNEFQHMRKRNRMVYSILSRQSHNSIYSQLAKLKVEYIILTHKDCFNYSEECRISDIWDYVEPENRHNIQVCVELFQKNISNFVKVYVSEKYLILKMFSHSVQLELKTINLKEMSM